MRFNALILGGLLLASCQSEPAYKVEGKIDNYEGRILLLSRNAEQKWDTLGNMVSADGSFSFTGIAAAPRVAEICPTNAKRVRIPVFLEKGNFTVKADVKKESEYTVSGGGELQQLRSEFARKEAELQVMRDSMRRVYEKENDVHDRLGRLQVRGFLAQMDTLADKAENDFIRTHDNMVSANLIMQKFGSLCRNKTLHQKYALLGENARNTPEGQFMKPYYEHELNIIVGGTAPNLEMQTPDGKKISLYDVKAKLKIVDFWASWCHPCRMENPNVRKIYAKYKDKGLEVVSVSFDNNREKWLKAIKDDKLPWVHMSDLKGWNSEGAKVYRISGIPQIFILDENNKILAEKMRGERLEKFIEEYLK